MKVNSIISTRDKTNPHHLGVWKMLTYRFCFLADLKFKACGKDGGILAIAISLTRKPQRSYTENKFI